MKLAIASDFHFGYNDDALPQAADCLNKALAMADAVVLAGDLFDSRLPKQETVNDALRVFRSFSKKFAAKNSVKVKAFSEDGNEVETDYAPIIAIYGTHERRTKGLVNAIQLLDSAGVIANCHAKPLVLEKKREGADAERVCVQGMGGIPEEYAKNAIDLIGFTPVERAFNLFVFHQTLQELIPQVGELALRSQDLPNGFDLYVDGHIHWKYDDVCEGKRILLPGSTVVTQMRKKEMEPKGFYLFDTLTGKADFVPILTRPFEFVELEFNAGSIAEINSMATKLVAEIAKRHEGQMPLVKLKIKGSLAAGLQASNLDLSELSKYFEGKMLLSIDKELESMELKEKIERLRKIREEKKSVRELGLDVLKQKLQSAAESNPTAKALSGREEELFDLLAENKVDDALKKISGE